MSEPRAPRAPRRPAKPEVKPEEFNITRKVLSEIMEIRRGRSLLTALVKMCYENFDLCKKYLEE
jgi:hypothetical protein